MNAEFIRMELSRQERLVRLNQIAIQQLKSLIGSEITKRLEDNK